MYDWTMPVSVCDHPLAEHLLGRLRDRTTPSDTYRRLTYTLGTMLALDATRDIPTTSVPVETPLKKTLVRKLDQSLAVVPVLRAGLGLLDPFLDLFPDVAVGYIGLERDERTAEARRYYAKLPVLEARYTVCVDPMLATGGSAAEAISMLKAAGAKDMRFVCVIAAPEGLERLQAAHPDLPIYTAAIDESLNAQKFIVPGLGDFGDRLYGTADMP